VKGKNRMRQEIDAKHKSPQLPAGLLSNEQTLNLFFISKETGAELMMEELDEPMLSRLRVEAEKLGVSLATMFMRSIRIEVEDDFLVKLPASNDPAPVSSAASPKTPRGYIMINIPEDDKKRLLKNVRECGLELRTLVKGILEFAALFMEEQVKLNRITNRSSQYPLFRQELHDKKN
jgi:hypothetical protein